MQLQDQASSVLLYTSVCLKSSVYCTIRNTTYISELLISDRKLFVSYSVYKVLWRYTAISYPESRSFTCVHQESWPLAWPDFLSMRWVFVSYSQPIRFARFEGKSVKRGLPVLEQPRGRDSSCWPKRVRPLRTIKRYTAVCASFFALNLTPTLSVCLVFSSTHHIQWTFVLEYFKRFNFGNSKLLLACMVWV